MVHAFYEQWVITVAVSQLHVAMRKGQSSFTQTLENNGIE
jgi:hypothetical protein